MKIVAILGLLLGVATSISWREHHLDTLPSDMNVDFKDWANAFNKTYPDIVEEAYRMTIFESTWKLVNTHNGEYDDGVHTFFMRLNQFSDMTVEEFNDYATCRSMFENGGGLAAALGAEPAVIDESVDVPSSIDWTNYNGQSYVTPVKNQGQCGSCWAFSATGATESLFAIKEGKTGNQITELSEQQLVDCDTQSGGCNGGSYQSAFNYIHTDGGLCTESEYPYTAKDGSCQASKCGQKYDTVSGYSSVQSGSTSGMESALAQQPVSIAVDASGSNWQNYGGGILTGNCGTQLDHGVLAVGYGSSNGDDYWKVKNSWGSGWGVQGYIFLCRNCNQQNGECGMLTEPVVPNA